MELTHDVGIRWPVNDARGASNDKAHSDKSSEFWDRENDLGLINKHLDAW